MPSQSAAIIRDGWIEMVIVPLSDDFDRRSSKEQDEVYDRTSKSAAAAGLKPSMALLWKGERGQLRHRGPSRWRSFMESVTIASVERRLNCTIDW